MTTLVILILLWTVLPVGLWVVYGLGVQRAERRRR